MAVLHILKRAVNFILDNKHKFVLPVDNSTPPPPTVTAKEFAISKSVGINF